MKLHVLIEAVFDTGEPDPDLEPVKLPTMEELSSILEYSTAREALSEATGCEVRLSLHSSHLLKDV